MTTIDKRMDMVRELSDMKHDGIWLCIQDFDYNGNIDADVHNLQRLANFFGVQIGRGGSHIWVSTLDNKRIGIIYYN